ncbi:hypothetical protein AALP_AA7G175200 [Arabis alpina]|uniref:TF-B3 domain-containing protein n=1 Tax=Arabis alpina TaxID=50452 RepID=A0A087GIQ6_ARAAL|nr:hypothetical protein AALP_AA7G175200 [Arabis alpina]
MVELTSEASKKTWKVKMEGQRLTVGWKDFAVAHDFRVGDVIIFRHQGDLVFHVMGFGPSCCEIQYVQSNNNDEDCDDNDDEDEEEEDNIRNSQVKTEPESSPEGEDKDSMGSKAIVIMDEGERTWMLSLRFRESSETFFMIHGWRSFCHENVLKPGDSVMFKLERNNTKTPLLRFFTSESKLVITKDSSKGKRKESGESSHIVSSPSSSLSENRFVTLTVTQSILKDGRLCLPRSFTRVNGMENAGAKKITVLDKNGVEWPDHVLQAPKNPHFFQPLLPGFDSYLKVPVKFFLEHIQGRNKRNTVELTSDACEKTWKVEMDGRRLTVGWKEFAGAHDFRVGDIIIFRHEGDFVFHVTGFGPSCCELQYEHDNIRDLSMEQNLKTDSSKGKRKETGESSHSQRVLSPSSSLSENRFVTLTVTSFTLKNCRLYLPRSFTKDNKMETARGKKITLMDKNGVEWLVSLLMDTGNMHFGEGLTNFLNAIGIKASESFVLELVWEDTTTPMLKFCSKVKT